MKRVSHLDQDCSMGRAIGVVGHWWSLLIVREAFRGVTRFDDFQRSLGISRNALTDRLRQLTEAGVLQREAVCPGQAREHYVLTPMGEDLLPVIVALRQWGDSWLFEGEELPSAMVDKCTGAVIPALQVLAADGRPMRRGDVVIRTL